MDRTIFAFIWRHSKRQQVVLLAVTLLSFPFLYATLELPKRIINDAISGGDEPRMVAGFALDQVGLLALLCAGFLLAVIGQGLMKMQINTMKGVLAERLLRRFRYQLIERTLRFPQPFFRRTSQGELVSMITAETEPLGGLMGDLVAQPVFQGGMMLTIMTFLFLQNPWLGFAAIALIPLQAWLIPLLQRRINQLNKARVREVRRLAETIGENAAGARDLRLNGGWRRRMAIVSARLGTLFDIRYRIYRQKFFMKFLNNFINQLTPFLFFAIGGYLAIQGELTVGALVAALAAYKDLSAPWKELLAWYNQTQDMSVRWATIAERFDTPALLEPEQLEGRPEAAPSLKGDISLERVTVREADGATVLDGVDVTLPAGGMIAVASRSAAERRAFAEVIAREVAPVTGRVRIGDRDLSTLHQSEISARVGYAGQQPYLFAGRVGDNVTMGLQAAPNGAGAAELPPSAAREEALRAGNSVDPVDTDWVDPRIAGVEDRRRLVDWWLQLTEAMETDMFLFEAGLNRRFDPAEHPELAEVLVALRPEIARRLDGAGLAKAVHRFDPGKFNPGLPVGGNLLFATPTRDVSQEEMAADPRFADALRTLSLDDDILKLGRSMLCTLNRTFGADGVEHPMFRKLEMDAALYHRLIDIELRATQKGAAALATPDRRLAQTVPFRFSAEQMGEGFTDDLKARILDLRGQQCETLLDIADGLFAPLDDGAVSTGLTVLENAIFGKLSISAGAKADKVRKIVSDALIEAGAKALVAELIYEVPTDVAGANLPPISHERIAFIRAAIKRPDVLILDRALASFDRDVRLRIRQRLRALLPETTLIFLEEDFVRRDSFDLALEIEDGRILGEDPTAAGEDAPHVAAEMKKLRMLEKNDLFGGVERRHLRLLAFGSTWVEVEAGERLFQAGDPADGAYLLARGRAELRWPHAQAGDRSVSEVSPGRLIGDLSVLRDEVRPFDFVATEPVKALRIEAEALRAVVEADARVAVSLLKTVSGYLMDVGGVLRDTRRSAAANPSPAPSAAE